MSDQQFRRDLICAALAGRSANYMRANGKSAALEAAVVIELADAALAAAGEQDGAMPWRDVAADFDAKLSAAQAEIARLKRLQEPLTEDEAQVAADLWDQMPGVEETRDLAIQWEECFTAVKNRRA